MPSVAIFLMSRMSTKTRVHRPFVPVVAVEIRDAGVTGYQRSAIV
jgi:hypothetical protein